jgi:hypothetical protein
MKPGAAAMSDWKPEPMIDWTRLAKPQPDHYDIPVLSQLDADRGFTPPPYPDNDPRPALFHGIVPCDVNRVPDLYHHPDMLKADVDQTWANAQMEYLTAWKDGATSLSLYLDEFWPYWANFTGKGCSSGHHVMTPELPLRACYVTINDLGGCAQGIYHEFAHLRLESMGIHIEKHDGKLLTNDPKELYNSSVRFDVQRPMSAVLHGLYAWLMFTENDYQNYAAGIFDVATFKQYSERNWVKIEAGWMEVDRYAKWNCDGVDFWIGCTTWTLDLLERCHAAGRSK